jgi:hypothetical protein
VAVAVTLVTQGGNNSVGSSSVSGAVATYTSASIGTAASDRVVVLCVSSELASGTIISATYDNGSGDTAMTAASQGTLGNNSARIFYATVATGTTATFKVTFGANPTSTSQRISVYSVTGSSGNVTHGSATSTDMDATAPLRAAVAIPTGGGFIATASCATDTVAKTWAGATEGADDDGGDMRHTTASSTTAGFSVVTCTGGTNGEDGGLSWISFCPTSTTFGDLIGAASNQALSVTNPFSPSTAQTISAGDLVFVAYAEVTGTTATGCTDNLGNTYSALTSGSTTSVYYTVATTGGACTPAIATTASARDASIVVGCYKGPFDGTPLDKNPAVTASDNAEPYTAPATGTLAQADELIVGYFLAFNNGEASYDTPSPSARGDAMVAIGTANTTSGALTSKVVAATTTLTFELSGGTGTRPHTCGVATFKKGSPTDALLANDVSSASSVSVPTIAQTHAILANDVSSASTVSVPALTQVHVILANDVSSASSVTTPALTEVIALTADDVSSASSVSVPTIGQIHAILANDVSSASSVTTPAIGQIHALLADDVASASSVTEPAVGQVHVLTADDVASASSVSVPAVGQVHVLTADDVASASSVSEPALAEGADTTDALLADDVISASSVSVPALGQIHALLAESVVSQSSVSTPAIASGSAAPGGGSPGVYIDRDAISDAVRRRKKKKEEAQQKLAALIAHNASLKVLARAQAKIDRLDRELQELGVEDDIEIILMLAA